MKNSHLALVLVFFLAFVSLQGQYYISDLNKFTPMYGGDEKVTTGELWFIQFVEDDGFAKHIDDRPVIKNFVKGQRVLSNVIKKDKGWVLEYTGFLEVKEISWDKGIKKVVLETWMDDTMGANTTHIEILTYSSGFPEGDKWFTSVIIIDFIGAHAFYSNSFTFRPDWAYDKN